MNIFEYAHVTPWTDLKKTFFENVDPYETGAIPMKSTQNLSPRRFWHAGHEFDVKTRQIRHPEPKMKKNHLYLKKTIN